MTNVNADLAVGVHPNDQRATPNYNNESPVNHNAVLPPSPTGDKPFSGTNYDALPVFERAAKEWSGRTIIVSQSIVLCTRKKGRKQITLFVPTTAAAGVSIFPTKGESDSAGIDDGVPIAVGASLDLFTEGGVYANELTSGTPGTVVVVEFYNPILDI